MKPNNFVKKLFLEKSPLFQGGLKLTNFCEKFELALKYTKKYVPSGCTINFIFRDMKNTYPCANFHGYAISRRLLDQKIQFHELIERNGHFVQSVRKKKTPPLSSP